MLNFLLRVVRKLHYYTSIPLAMTTLLGSKKIHPAYRLSLLDQLKLGYKMFQNQKHIQTGTSYRVHLALASKILETPPELKGDIVECGTWKGGCAANLSLVCKITGRKLRIYDSFQGLPPIDPNDREGQGYQAGDFKGTLDEVKTNIAQHGAIECCEFIQGWFEDTLPALDTPVLLAFVDVDLDASLDTCVRHLWPNLTEHGHLFIDEVASTDYCALFYSERWWKENFDRTPPGLIGAGTGLPLGNFYVGPHQDNDQHPFQYPDSGAYTQKSMSGYWAFYRK